MQADLTAGCMGDCHMVGRRSDGDLLRRDRQGGWIQQCICDLKGAPGLSPQLQAQGVLRHQLQQALLQCLSLASGAVARATFLREASAGPQGCGRLGAEIDRVRLGVGALKGEWQQSGLRA